MRIVSIDVSVCFAVLIFLGTAGAVLPCPAMQDAPKQVAAPKFEVVSIKQSGPGEQIDVRPFLSGGLFPGIFPHGEYRINHLSFLNLLATAYSDEITNAVMQISGGPEWAHAVGPSIYFDIDAKPSDTYPNLPYVQNAEQVRLMLQAMLADRFQLRFHRDSRMADGFRLEVAPGGPKNLIPASLNDEGMAVDPNYGPGPIVPDWVTQKGSNQDVWMFGSPAMSM